MPNLTSPDELKTALINLPGVTLSSGYGTSIFVNGERVMTLGQWQDTNRLLINVNGRERMSSFPAVFARIKKLIK